MTMGSDSSMRSGGNKIMSRLTFDYVLRQESKEEVQAQAGVFYQVGTGAQTGVCAQGGVQDQVGVQQTHVEV